MAEPKLVRGTLYIDRDQDLRTGEWGPYIKIGIVRNDKEASARNKEHQTGNPRKIHILHELPAPMVENLETRLHHFFAQHWVFGEWFLMDNEFIETHVLPKAYEIIKQQEETMAAFSAKQRLKDTLSDGTVREPTPSEVALGESYKMAKERFDRATAMKEVLRSKLLQAMGDVGGIEGVVTLQQNSSGGTFDKSGFKKIHPDLYDQYISTKEEGPKGTLTVKTGLPFSKMNPSLNEEGATAKKLSGSLAVELLQAEKGLLSTTVIQAHLDYVKILAELSAAEFESYMLKAALAEAIGTADEIEGIVRWPRTIKQVEKFDSVAFKENNPELYDSFTKPITYSVTPKVSMCRPYNLDINE